MNVRSALLPCLFSALTTTLLAGPPQYSSRQDITTGFQHLSGLAVADFNGDGITDIAVTDSSDKHVVVYLGSKTNTFSAPISTLIQTSSNSSTGLFRVVAGDFNEDGKQDLIVAANSSEPLIYLSGNGDGTFTQKSTVSGSSQFFNNARVIDLNHDSHLDLVVTGNPGFGVFLGDGHGNFQPSASSGMVVPPVAPYDIVAADFNGDNMIDVLTSYPSTNSWLTGIALNSGNGDGTFRPYTVAGDSNSSNNMLVAPWYLAAADFNGDGKQDILIGEADADMLFYGKGDGTFDLTHPDSPATLAPINPNNLAIPLVAAADMDGDGKIDAVIADDASQTVDVDINNGSGNFMGVAGHYNVPDVTLGIDPGTSHLAVADLNGDGLPDIVVTNSKTQNVTVFFSIRPKTTPSVTLTSSANSQFVGASLSFTAKITGTSYTPTGTVTLLDGTTSLGQQTLDSSGQAAFSLSNLAAGQHSLSVSYSGDTNFLAATSTALTQSVTDFQITVPSNSQTVTAGGSATYSFTLTPAGGLTGSITLTCSQLPSLATCDPLTVPITGQPATATLTVHTTAPVRSQHRSSIHAASIGLLSIVFTALLPLRRRRHLQIIVCLVAMLLTGFTVGCSSGTSTSTQPPVTVTPGTPQSTTSFAITSSISLGQQTLTHSTTATLVVQ